YSVLVSDVFFFFFFQAEDGIRDRNVTGVQTCALPISFHCSTSNKSKVVGRLSAASTILSLLFMRPRCCIFEKFADYYDSMLITPHQVAMVNNLPPMMQRLCMHR